MNIIITGATSGIGMATAEQFLTTNPSAKLWLIGRRSDRLQALQNKWNTHEINISTVDVRNNAEVIHWAEAVANTWDHIDVLVNNAGLALGVNAFQDGDIADWETMIDTNIKGTLYVTKALFPLLARKPYSQIYNIGSTAGKMAYENGNVYCATKFAVDALGQSMRIDFLKYAIKVTNINPGMVETEFSIVRLKGDTEKAKAVYENYDALRPEDIAKVIHYCSALPPHVCINDLTVTCTQQANAIYKLPHP